MDEGDSFDEGRRDALGDADRKTGVETDEFEVGDGAKIFYEGAEILVGEGERVATAEDHLVNCRVTSDVGDLGLEVGGFFVGEIFSEAVAAVHGAG